MSLTPSTFGNDALTGGFTDPVFDGQSVFKLMMDAMDGFEATLEIRKDPRWRKLPIIAVTAKAMKDDQERCLQAGSNDYLAKPIDLDRLFSLIRVWLPKMERI